MRNHKLRQDYQTDINQMNNHIMIIFRKALFEQRHAIMTMRADDIIANTSHNLAKKTF